MGGGGAPLVGGYLYAQPLLPYYLPSLFRRLIFMFSTSNVYLCYDRQIY